MGYFKIINKKNKPNRLFIGGVHGNEGSSTINALEKIDDTHVSSGSLVIYNCDQTKYISTLDPHYYQSKIGKEILYLINYYQPTVYVEAHCYKPESYSKLMDPDRQLKVGVPPLIELEKDVLIGSVSPFLRINFFKREDVCITLEMPCNPPKDSLNVYTEVLKMIAGSKNREELEEKMVKLYPEQVKTAQKYAREFFGEYPPF